MLSSAFVIQRVRWHLQALRVQVSLRRLGLTLNAYDANQPRVPAGSSEGGEWTDGDLGGEIFQDDDARIVLAGDASDRRYHILLDEEEDYGHTLRDHVGKTDDEMISRIERETWRTSTTLAKGMLT